jgi:hypothetical protein
LDQSSYSVIVDSDLQVVRDKGLIESSICVIILEFVTHLLHKLWV